MNSEQQMSEIEIPTPSQSERSEVHSEDSQYNVSPKIAKADSREEIIEEPIISQEIQRKIIQILDVLGLVGLIIYCSIIQSYYSTFYLLCLLMILNYTYINLYKGVMTREGKLYSLQEFSLQQDQFHNIQSNTNNDNQQTFITQYWLEIYDIKKLIWIAYIVVSALSLIAKLSLYPLIKNGGQNIMSMSNFNGLEIYFTIHNGQATVNSNEQGLAFAPNCIMLVLACVILVFRNIKQKKEFYEFQEPPILTKFLILLMLFNLIILTCCTKSFIGLVMWVFQLIMLFRMFQNKLMEKNFFIVLKYIMMTFFFIMYFISTPIKSAILQNSQAASFTLQFSGFQLFGYFSQYETQAILFIIFSIIVINMLCLINQKINTQKIQSLFEHTIKEISSQYEDYKQYQQMVSSEIEKLSVDLDSSPKNEKKNSSNDENLILDSHDIDEDEESKGEVKQSGTQRLSEYLTEQQVRTSQIFTKIQEVSYSKLGEILKLFDKPLVSLIILQILSITIVIIQQTYFSILLVMWLILTGFTLNLQTIRLATIYLNIPSLLINFFTFYYSNITGMSRPNNFYQFCPSSDFKDVNELPDNVCEKLGFFYQEHSAINTTIMDITLCLFFLFIKQVEEETARKKEQILPVAHETKNIGWLKILLAFLFKIGFLIVIVLLYWVGFNEINIIQFFMILLLIIFIVNQSTKYNYQGRRVPFQQKYWIILLFYISLICMAKYLYILFGVSSNYFVVQVLGFNSLNKQWVVNWILFYMIVIQYYGFQSQIYDKFSNRLIATISDVDTVQKKLPKFKQSFGILETLFGHSIIWVTYAVNLCFLLFTPYSYLNNILLLYIGIVFLYHVQSINTEINYSRLRSLWYVYMYLLLIAFAYRYLFSFFCVPDLSDKSEGFQRFYQNLQLYYQEAGLYAYSTDSLRSEYLADTLNILFGAFALNQFTKFQKLQQRRKNENFSEASTQNVLDLQILESQLWLKAILIGIAHINTDLITIYIVLSCVFYLRSAAAFILLTLYLSYFFRVHNKILDLLDEKQILQRLQQQITKLKQIYLEINLNLSHNEEPKQIKHLNDQIKLLRLTTRIKLKRAIWLYSFYFTAFCIFLTYFSQFLSTETFTAIVSPPLWVDNTVISFFVFGTYSRQYQITNQCYCGYESNNNDCNDTNYVQTQSNMWDVSWFYLFLLFVNVIDTACTKILEDDLTKSIENLQEIQEKDQIEEVRLQNLSYEESKEIFDHKYDFITFMKSNQEYKSFDREILIMNFFFNKNRFVKLLLNEAIFKTFQRTLILLYLTNTLLVNTVFSLFYLTISAILFQMKASVKNTKLLNSLAIFSILFQYFLYLLNWTPSQQEVPYLNGVQLNPENFNIMAKTHISEYWLSFLGFESSEIMDCEKLHSATSYFRDYTCETNQYLNAVIVFNCIIVSFIYAYFLTLEWFCNQIYRISIKMKNEFIICHKVLQNNDDQKIIINYNLYRQKNYSFRHILIQTITMNYHLILFGFVLLLCEANRSMFNLCQLLILIFFLYLTEFHFKWPYALLRRRVLRVFYQCIFVISSIIIALYTLLKIPNFLSYCVDAQTLSPTDEINDDTIYISPNDALIFYCMEAFSLRITGQIFLMFAITLYFDLQDSHHMKDSQQNYQNRLMLRANMVSKGLAYSYNYQQYKQILKLQDEKNILNQISETIEQKMIIWTKRVKQPKKQDEMTFSGDFSGQRFPQLTASFVTEAEVEIPKEQSFFRKMYLKMIIWMRTDSQSIKFMPFHILMDYIMQQNKRLQLHMYIKIENHLKNDTTMYEQRMDLLDKIYRRFYSEIAKRKDKLQNNQLDEMITEIMKRYEKIYRNKEKDTQYEKLQQKYQYQQQSNYNLSKELRFVHIYDSEDRIIFEQTKSKYPIHKLFNLKTSSLFVIFLEDIFKYCLINWDTITNLFIISYYFKNYALFGMILPIVMFIWALIDIHQRTFWMIAYSVFFFIMLIIFVDSMYGIAYSKSPDIQYIPWYYVLDNSNTFDLFYEIFIIWIITFQVFLQKTFGIFNYPFTQVENIFQGYIRLKANNFSKDMISEIVEEVQVVRQRSNSEMFRKPHPEIVKIDEENQIQGQSFLEKSGIAEEPGTISADIKNELERKISANPAIIGDKYVPSFFEKTLSYEYARPGQDLYVPIAFVQVILFLYMLFFYNFMTGESQNIEKYLKYNQVPAQLVLALVFQMIFMMIERFIELRGDQKFLKSQQKQVYKNKYKTQFVLKYILQIVILTLVVYFVYFYLLKLWTRDVYNYQEYNSSVVFFFIFFCAYFYLSALQLRYGYRELKVRNQFLYVYNTTGYLFAQVFYSIPFLYDLKVLMDWTFLYTSLNVFQWFTLEDIHRQLYFTKNQSLGTLRRKLGMKIQWIMKLSLGCCLVFFISICIFGPLILFSALNPAAEYNPITSGDFQINLINVDTNLNVGLYQSSQLFGLDLPFLQTADEIKDATNSNKITEAQIQKSQQFGGIQRFQLADFSNTKWQISQPLYTQLIKELTETIDYERNYTFMLNVTFTFRRQNQFILPTITKFSYPFNPQINGDNGPIGLTRDQLRYIKSASASCNQTGILLKKFYIEALRIYQSSATSYNATPIYGNGINSVQDVFMNINCTENTTNPLLGVSNWQFSYAGTSDQLNNQTNITNANGLLYYAICDKFSTLTSGLSVITIYTSIIIIISSYIRSLFSGQIFLLEFTQMVQPEDLLAICQAISVARQLQNYKKENLLYFELIDILRSPELVKIMTGTWQEAFSSQFEEKKKYEIQDDQEKLKQD